MLSILATDMGMFPDWTFGVQLVFFLITLIIVNWLVVRPTQRLYDKRRAATSGADVEVRDLNAKGEELDLNRNRQLEIVRKKIHEEAQKKIGEARLECEKIITAARQECNKQILDAREKARSEVERSEGQIGDQSEKIAADIIDKIFAS